MTALCKGICHRYKAGKPVDGFRYAASQKRCSICEVYMETDRLRCPCCNRMFRIAPKKRQYKQINRAHNESRKQESSVVVAVVDS